MAIKLENKTRVDAPDGTYPYGKIRDKSESLGGTPVNVEVYGDFHQTFAKLLAESGVIATGLPDNATNGFDYFMALWKFGNLSFVKDLIVGLLGSYTTNDLIKLYGCVVTPTIPGSSTITAGAIYYNGIMYKVPAATVVTTGSETLVFKINTTVQPNTIYLTNGASGSGIADYDAASVKIFSSFPSLITEIALVASNLSAFAATVNSPEAWIAPTLGSGVTNSGSTNPAGYYKDASGIVRLKGLVVYTNGTPGSNITLFTLPAGYRPAWPMRFPVSWQGSASTITSFTSNNFMGIIINTDGTVQIISYVDTTSASYDLSSISFRNS